MADRKASPIESINSVFSQIAARCVSLHMRTWCLPCEYEEYGVDTGDTEEEEESHNTWNALLEALTMPGSRPPIQQSLQDWEVCRMALSCHFALDILYIHGVASGRDGSVS